jgi:hypothetical protein
MIGVIVKSRFSFSRRRPIFVLLIISISLLTRSHTYAYKESGVPYRVKLSPRLEGLFDKTKLLCFGRFAIEVPLEAQLDWGETSFPSRIEVISGGIEAAKERAVEDIGELDRKKIGAEVVYNGPGPIENSWQLRYFDDKFAKEDNDIFFNTYLNKAKFIFILGDATEKNETEETVIARQLSMSKSLRLRKEEDIPTQPGYCIEHGFMADDRYADQEMASAGIHLPSLPDVTFSISSNKDAYADYPKADFERMKRDELPLLARIKAAQKTQGEYYPLRNVLREGKRDVQHWHGEESLFKRSDGTHDFEWAYVGTPRDVANPSEFGVAMFTKVEDNMVGAASAASLSDDEAVALWDKLLSGLKFRVKVPGAPEGSYYFPKAK